VDDGEHIAAALPVPAIFSNLKQLCINWCDPTWLPRLSGLQHLLSLQLDLGGWHADNGPVQEAVVPAMADLEALQVIAILNDPAVPVRVCLAGLPSLRSLTLHVRGHAAVAADAVGQLAAPASRLTHVGLTARSLAVDLSLLPALQEIGGLAGDDLQGASSIAAATALSSMRLGPRYRFLQERPWVEELLRTAPPSLRRLAVVGDWTDQAAEAAGGLTQLTAMALIMPSGHAIRAPSAISPVWKSLRAFDWLPGSGTPPLPQVSSAEKV
jgi:hypothetical protein